MMFLSDILVEIRADRSPIAKRLVPAAVVLMIGFLAIVPRSFSFNAGPHLLSFAICGSIAHAQDDNGGGGGGGDNGGGDDDDDDNSPSDTATPPPCQPSLNADGTTTSCPCQSAVGIGANTEGHSGSPVSPSYTPTPPVPTPTPVPNPSDATITATPIEVAVGSSTVISWAAGNVSQCYVTGPNLQQPYSQTGYSFSDPTDCGAGSFTTGIYTTPGYYTYYYTYTLPNVGQASVTVRVDSDSPGTNDCPSGDICTACLASDEAGECLSCSAGSVLSEGACVFTDCPAGYSYDNGECVVSSCTPQYVCGTGDSLYYEDRTCAVSAVPAQACGYGCSGGECLPPPAPKIISFAVSPILVKSGETTSVSWNVQDVSGCSVSGTNGDGPWTGQTGTESSSPIIGQVIYTLHCGVIPGAQNADGSLATWTDQADTVNIAPTYQEK